MTNLPTYIPTFIHTCTQHVHMHSFLHIDTYLDTYTNTYLHACTASYIPAYPPRYVHTYTFDPPNSAAYPHYRGRRDEYLHAHLPADIQTNVHTLLPPSTTTNPRAERGGGWTDWHIYLHYISQTSGIFEYDICA